MKKYLLAAILIVSSGTYAQNIYNNDGLEVGVNGVFNVGLKSQSINIDNNGTEYKNVKNGLDEDAAFLTLNIKKKVGNIEAGGNIRYGASYENNKDRTGGDAYIKYNFNKAYLEFKKYDFGYTKTTLYSVPGGVSAVTTGKNLGTGILMDINPVGYMADPVISPVEVDYGVSFLGNGLNGIMWSQESVIPSGGIWNSFMAFKDNYNNYDMKPYALNAGYKGASYNLDASLVYQTKDVTKEATNQKINAANLGLSTKFTYVLNKTSKFGAGVSYGQGESEISNVTTDSTTEITAQNLWYDAKFKTVAIFMEAGHSLYQVDSTLGTEKELLGIYGKASKTLAFGTPYVEAKIAQSTFDKVSGSEYAEAQVNTLMEFTGGLRMPIKSAPRAAVTVYGTYGTYDSENVTGTLGNDYNGNQIKVGTNISYVF